MQEGSYERVCKKVRTSVCASRFVRAEVQKRFVQVSARILIQVNAEKLVLVDAELVGVD